MQQDRPCPYSALRDRARCHGWGAINPECSPHAGAAGPGQPFPSKFPSLSPSFSPHSQLPHFLKLLHLSRNDQRPRTSSRHHRQTSPHSRPKTDQRIYLDGTAPMNESRPAAARGDAAAMAPEPTSRPRKRQKISLACEECRSRKVRCDGIRPRCTACSRKRRERPCQYPSEPAKVSSDRR